jgi:hypothetical protein
MATRRVSTGNGGASGSSVSQPQWVVGFRRHDRAAVLTTTAGRNRSRRPTPAVFHDSADVL